MNIREKLISNGTIRPVRGIGRTRRKSGKTRLPPVDYVPVKKGRVRRG